MINNKYFNFEQLPLARLSVGRSGQPGQISPSLEQRSHRRLQEVLCLRVEWLLEGGEALQGAVHARGAHEKAHGGETAQMHREFYYLKLV